SPSQIAAGEAPKDRAFRVGGLVEAGGGRRPGGGIPRRFVGAGTPPGISVGYQGVPPPPFSRGQRAVAGGRACTGGGCPGEDVLAKHDENYMPPEAAHALEQAQKAQRTVKQ